MEGNYRSRCLSCAGLSGTNFSCLVCSYPIERVRLYLSRDNGEVLSNGKDANHARDPHSRRSRLGRLAFVENYEGR
jgi:hypothetical protein